MTFGNRLKELRKAKNLTQEELALKFFVSRQAVTKWENDKSMPDFENLAALADFFEVSLEYLITGEEKPLEAKKRKILPTILLASICLLVGIGLGVLFSWLFWSK